MLCSVQTGKSGPNWLDRLRFSKGFPADDGLDLDHYLLQSSSPPTTPIILPKPVRPDPDLSEPDDDKENTGMYGTLTNVLAELFNFETKQPISKKKQRKKSARKQKRPRICVLNSEEKCSNNGSDDGNFVNFQDGKGNDNNLRNVKGNRSNENDGGDLVGYSRTEVTVIDTSFDNWKFDKVLYRRKNVWKVRDKKGKPKDAGRKRRKEIVNNGNEEDSNKKPKVSRHEAFGILSVYSVLATTPQLLKLIEFLIPSFVQIIRKINGMMQLHKHQRLLAPFLRRGLLSLGNQDRTQKAIIRNFRQSHLAVSNLD